MKLRSPSGKVITNKFIRSKLQKRQEKFSYSSSFTTPLLFSDVAWVNSHLINVGVFDRFVIRHKSQIDGVLRQLVLSLKKIQHYEFFIENAKSEVFRLTGIRLISEDLTGAWYRCVDFDTLLIKLLYTAQLALSIKNFAGFGVNSQSIESKESASLFTNEAKTWTRLLGHEVFNSHVNYAWLEILFFLVKQLNHPNMRSSGFPMVFSSGELAVSFIFIPDDELIQLKSSEFGSRESIEFIIGGSEKTLVLSKGGRKVTISLVHIARLYDLFSVNNQLQVCQGFMQSLILDSEMVLSYEQRRLIFLLVHILSLNVLVKRKR